MSPIRAYRHVGDITSVDSDGNLAFHDRDKDLIKSGGEWIATVELEGHLCQHSAQKATNELLYTDDIITADRAEARMINRVLPGDELTGAAEKLAHKIALTPLSILRFTTRTITRAYDAMGLASAVESNLDTESVLNSPASGVHQLGGDQRARGRAGVA